MKADLELFIKTWDLRYVIEKRVETEAWAEWSLTAPPGSLAPDTTVPKDIPVHSIISFARSCMP